MWEGLYNIKFICLVFVNYPNSLTTYLNRIKISTQCTIQLPYCIIPSDCDIFCCFYQIFGRSNVSQKFLHSRTSFQRFSTHSKGFLNDHGGIVYLITNNCIFCSLFSHTLIEIVYGKFAGKKAIWGEGGGYVSGKVCILEG